jgi:hypothetical protein
MKDMALVGLKTEIKPGIRVSQDDPQHRTKGAKSGTKPQLSQGNNFGRPDAGTKRRKPSTERARARRRMRREMERSMNAVARPLKTPKGVHSSGHIATDYSHMIHEAMHPCSQAHIDLHRGLGTRADLCQIAKGG